jgi:hypothetical protein
MRALVRLAGCALAAATFAPLDAAADCSLTTTGVTPLMDLAGTYLGFEGGLYPGGTSSRDDAHEAAGILIATGDVVPLDAAGVPDPAGAIVLLSVGMCNTSQEFDDFVMTSAIDPSINPALVVVNGAQGGQTAAIWADPLSMPWGVVDMRLTAAGVTPEQVEVVWIKEANAGPAMDGAFPLHAQLLQANLEDIARNLRARYPNLRLTYWSSRTRAYTADSTTLNPEPYAFESAYSVKWMIEAQIGGEPTLSYDPATGVAAWMSWGPYLWADGTAGRSDGFVWECTDTVMDFTHPSPTGQVKVAEELTAFFKTDPTATPWFLTPDVIGAPPTCAPTAAPASGDPPLAVTFTPNSADSDGTVVAHVWTFDDGGFSYAPSPAKTFLVPGTYQVHLTVIDDDANPSTCTVPVSVGVAAPPSDAGVLPDAGADAGSGDAGASPPPPGGCGCTVVGAR